MRGQALIAAGLMALTAGLAPTIASAQSYQQGSYAAPAPYYQGDPNCGQRKTKNALLGGLAGAALGAVVGSNMSRGGHRSDNGILGGVIGGAAGAGIGASGTNCAATGVAYGGPYTQPAQPAPPPSDRYGYNNGDDDELLGGPGYRDDRGYRGDGRRYAYRAECRTMERVVRDRYGYERRIPVETCRDPYSGEWVIQR